MLKMQKTEKCYCRTYPNNYELHESRKRQPNFQFKTVEFEKKKKSGIVCIAG